MGRNIFHIFFCPIALSLMAVACSEELEAPQGEFEIEFSAEVEQNSENQTKAALYNSKSEIETAGVDLTVDGWEGDTKWIDSKTVTYSSGAWSGLGGYALKKTNNYTFFSYGNIPSGASVSTAKATGITLTVSAIEDAQSDILLGSAVKNTPADGNVSISYTHPFASVKFKIGNIDGTTSVSKIALTGVYAGGKTTLGTSSSGYTWTDLGTANGTLEKTATVDMGEVIETFVVIPQVLSTKNVAVTITYDTDKTLTKIINSGEWKAGYTTTYTVNGIGGVQLTVTGADGIRNNSLTKSYIRATVTGAWYDGDGNIVGPWNGTLTNLAPSTYWETDGGYYYLKNYLDSGETASALFTGYTPGTAVAGATLKLDVIVQAIPYDVNYDSCKAAFAALL